MRKMMMALPVLFAVLALSAPAPQTLSPVVKSFVTVDAPVFALAHVRVVDGTGAPALEDQTIVVSDGKIQAIGGASSTSVPPEAKVFELRGYTVIPGLVGMHNHIFYPAGRPSSRVSSRPWRRRSGSLT